MSSQSGRCQGGYPPRLSPQRAKEFSGLSEQQLKALRRSRAVRFYRTGHRSVVYDRDSLAAWLETRAIEPLGGGS